METLLVLAGLAVMIFLFIRPDRKPTNKIDNPWNNGSFGGSGGVGGDVDTSNDKDKIINDTTHKI